MWLLQVKAVEEACTDYLLNLDLSAEQLGQLMMLLNRLMLMDACSKLLGQHVYKTWTNEVMVVLPFLCKQLVCGGPQDVQLCKDVLHNVRCGALCEIQARDCSEKHYSSVCTAFTFKCMSLDVPTCMHVPTLLQAVFTAIAISHALIACLLLLKV